MVSNAKVCASLKRTYVLGLVPALALSAACGAKRPPAGDGPGKAVELAEAIGPGKLAKALQRLGGARFKGTSRFEVRAGYAPVEIATTTDVTVDRAGNYRFHEDNDRDGGRDVVLYGRELAVALRYGKMIRRVAEEPEPTRLLEEALGAPFAAFELVSPRTHVSRAGSELYGGAQTTVFELGLGDGDAGKRLPSSSRRRAVDLPDGLRAWRATAEVDAVSGRALVDDATGALMKLDLSARFSAKPDGGAVTGTVEVHTAVSEVAAVAPVARPQAEELALRQRLVPEQRELLRGLSELRPPPEPPARRPPARRRAPTPKPAAPSE
jgi:hypothetical protein